MKQETYIPRTLDRIIQKASQSFKVVLLTGLRQVGKSTSLRSLGNRRLNLSFDDLNSYNLAKSSPDTFFHQFPPPITIDEVQRLPSFFLTIKALVDKSDAKGQVWLTGSQKFELLKGVTEGLPGRMVDFELMTLSLYEHQNKAMEQNPYIPRPYKERGSLRNEGPEKVLEYIWKGNWPNLEMLDPEEREWFYKGFLHSYLERDVLRTGGVAKITEFEKFLRVVATRAGQELKIVALARDCGIRTETANRWLSILEASGLIVFLRPFYANIGKTLIKSPKIYFTDPGLACYLLEIESPETLKSYYNLGALYENYVLMEIWKSWVHNGKQPRFFFYRDLKQKEVDLLIKVGDTYHPIEIKMTDAPYPSMISNFDVLRKAGVKLGRGALICNTPEPHILTSDVSAISVWDL